MVKYALRGIAISVLVTIVVVSVWLQQSQAKYTIVMSGYHTPVATATATPPGCQTIPGTSIQVGAACFPRTSCPVEDAFAHDPASFGADPTGVADASSAISQAIAAGVAQGGKGDVFFGNPTGSNPTYNITLTAGGTYVNPWGITPPANAKIECAAGVTLKTTTTLFTTDAGAFALVNNNNVVCGCNYVGPQTGAGPMTITSVGSQNDFVQVIGGTGHLIEGNTISRVAGNSAIQLNFNHNPLGAAGCPGTVTAQYNTFNLLPYYAVNIDCQVNTATIANNLVTDGDMGPEWDGCPAGGSIGSNIKYINNEVITTTGNCSNTTDPNGSAGCHGPGYLSNFSNAGSCNYSGVIFGGSAANANYCAGLPGTLVKPLAAHYENAPVDAAPPAIFSNNILGPNCSCTGTSPC